MKSLYQRLVFFASLCVVTTLTAHAQVVRGKITDEVTKEALIGATVHVKGTNNAAATDTSGAFALTVANPLPVTLVFSYIGYLAKEIEIFEEEEGLEITLKPRLAIAEVVITAVGIQSEKKTIGYSATEVQGSELVQSREPNLVTALAGKVAGVQINNSSGAPGASATIRIRGNNSLLGNNAPLYVIDGVPVDNSTELVYQSNFVSGVTPSNRAIDVNPDDVASMTVLKGPAAAALYGIRAGNGAIVITTKRGENSLNKGLKISYSTSYTVEHLLRRLQQRQNSFGPGNNGKLAVPGEAASVDSWGPRIDTLTYSNSPSPWYQGGAIVGQSNVNSNGTPVEKFDNVKNFFQTGHTITNSLSIAKRTETTGVYFSASRLSQTGIVPNSDFHRSTARLTVDQALTKKFKATSSVFYSNSGSDNQPTIGGAANGILRGLVNTNPTFDNSNGQSNPFSSPGAYLLPDGSQRAYGGGKVGWDNPYWSLNYNPASNEVNRFTGFLQGEYEFKPWASLTARAGNDVSSEVDQQALNKGAIASPLGSIGNYAFSRKDITTDIYLTFQKQVAQDLHATLLVGHNYYSKYRYSQISSGNGLIIPGFFNLSNATSYNATQTLTKKRLVAGFADLKLDYKGYLFLEATARNEWTSTLPKGKNSFFYPSANASYVFSKALHLENARFSFGKIRASAAIVGNDADPYSLVSYLSAPGTSSITGIGSTLNFPVNGISGFAVSNTLGNANLKPERISTVEAGFELRFFRNRLGIDFTAYSTKAKDEILPITIPSSSGYTSTLANAGVLTNKGLEVLLTGTPVVTRDFSWDVTLNWAHNESKVVSLAPGINILNISRGLSPSAVVGYSYGSFYGTQLLKNTSGQVIIDDKATLASGQVNPNYGHPLVDPNPGVIGNPNPLWNAGLRNTFTYKNWSLSFLWDNRYKFDVQNLAHSQMALNGSSAVTEDRGSNKVFEGVKQSNGAANDISIPVGQYWYQNVSWNVNSLWIEKDIYWLKLRDVNLTWSLPQAWISKAKISKVDLTLTGRNLLLFTNYSGGDPDVLVGGGNYTSFGLDFWTVPNTRSYGISAAVTF